MVKLYIAEGDGWKLFERFDAHVDSNGQVKVSPGLLWGGDLFQIEKYLESKHLVFNVTWHMSNGLMTMPEPVQPAPDPDPDPDPEE